MVSAYATAASNVSSNGRSFEYLIPFIPCWQETKNGMSLLIDFLRDEEDVAQVKYLMDTVIEEGTSWPFEDKLSDVEFRGYFFAHTALVVKSETGQVVGAFYCKPNFPGRCSHYCNGGFITHPDFRRQGVALCMVDMFLRVGKALGFRAALFNLVFVRNVASVRLWNKLGFRKLATLPRVGRLKDGYSDAIQFYYDLDDVGKERAGRVKAIVHVLYRKLPSICCGLILFFAGKTWERRKH